MMHRPVATSLVARLCLPAARHAAPEETETETAVAVQVEAARSRTDQSGDLSKRAGDRRSGCRADGHGA